MLTSRLVVFVGIWVCSGMIGVLWPVGSVVALLVTLTSLTLGGSSQPLDVRHSPARPSCMVLPTGCCFAKVHPDGVAVSPASGQKFTSPSSLPSRMLSSLISLKISFPLLYPTAPCKALAALPMKSSGLALYDPLASAEQNYSLSFVSCTYLLSGAVLHGCLPTFHPTDHQAQLRAVCNLKTCF